LDTARHWQGQRAGCPFWPRGQHAAVGLAPALLDIEEARRRPRAPARHSMPTTGPLRASACAPLQHVSQGSAWLPWPGRRRRGPPDAEPACRPHRRPSNWCASIPPGGCNCSLHPPTATGLVPRGRPRRGPPAAMDHHRPARTPKAAPGRVGIRSKAAIQPGHTAITWPPGHRGGL